MSEKREKFVKIAESRTKNAIKAIRTIGKLSNKNSYDFDDSDVQKIVKALQTEIEEMKRKFKSVDDKSEIEFTL